MNTFRTRLTRGFAVLIAAIVPVTLLGMSAAYADHFTVDRDNVAVGGFSGAMESWHDGNNTRATLTGTFQSEGQVDVTFVFADGHKTTVFSSMAQNAFSTTSASGASVVRFTLEFRYGDDRCGSGAVTDDNGNCVPAVTSKTWYVGDSPDSLGSCDQLDADTVSVSQTGFALFSGRTTYFCSTSTGRIFASVRGNLYWQQGTAGSRANVRVAFHYSDGTGEFVSNATNSITSATSGKSISTIYSNLAKNVRTVQVTVTRDDLAGPSTTGQFGDG
jgi:hypothetical protein